MRINREFFLTHQSTLLWLLNTPVVRRWFRCVLRIHGKASEVGNRRIVGILPHAIQWVADNGEELTAEFRTHPKFAKRLHYAFYPLWLFLGYVNPHLAFSQKFFERYQDRLVWLINSPYTRRVMRFSLRIHGEGSGVGKRDVVKIAHNAIWWEDDGKYIAEFRTHAKYSKRMYYAFRPLWWLLHAWDWAIADRFVPAWSFGFNNLTVYPDADPETTTVDGAVWYDNDPGAGESWATCIAKSTGYGALDDVAGDTVGWTQCHADTDLFRGFERLFFLFDTSALTSGADVSGADFSVASRDASGTKYDNIGGGSAIQIALFGATPASNTALSTSDFPNVGSTAFTSYFTYASWSATDGAYNVLSLNASGLAALAKTGVSKFSVRTYWDAAASTPPYASGDVGTALRNYFADQTGTSNDPKLTVAYTLNAGGVLTAYPDADPEATTVDGFSEVYEESGVSWATLEASTAYSATDTDTGPGSFVRIISSSGADAWTIIRRAFFLFDTSALTSGATVSSSVLSIWGYLKEDGLGISPSLDVYTSNPASNTALVGSDYATAGSTSQTGGATTYAGFTTGNYHGFTFDATGRGNVSKTGISKFAILEATYDVGAATPTWSDSLQSRFQTYWADQTGVTYDPKLVVTYSLVDYTFTGTLAATRTYQSQRTINIVRVTTQVAQRYIASGRTINIVRTANLVEERYLNSVVMSEHVQQGTLYKSQAWESYVEFLAGLVLQEEGFRFRNDDGTEATATWKADQDTNILTAANATMRVRFVLNTTGSAGEKQWQLEYRRSTTDNWRKVQ